MIEIQQPVERVLLVGAPELVVPEALVDEHIRELGRLTDTAGGEAVGVMVQRLRAPHPATFIGSGKVEELRREVAAAGATLVVFDEDLAPAQGSALEQQLGVRVMDRTELILDIFALHARTAESKLQVELAQLRYLRPRLKRMWTHLSRTQGGIGARGPGEQQIETDRRLIDRRISRLERELKHIARSRQTRRKARRGEFRVSLIGYTNTGKSSILRGLSGSDVVVADQLFATLDSATRAVDVGAGSRALLTDTVGFIRKLPHHLVASFRATLEEVEDADLLFHVIDASANWDEQVDSVNRVLQQLERRGPVLLVFNKIDRLTHEEEATLRARTELLGSRVFVSAYEPGGLEALREELQSRIRATRPTVRVRFSSTDGRTLAEAYREGEVLSREDNGSTIELTARIPEALLGRWRAQAGIEVSRQDAA